MSNPAERADLIIRNIELQKQHEGRTGEQEGLSSCINMGCDDTDHNFALG